MDKEYKFISKFIEGKTYNELTDEEIEKLKSGIGVKKEDKEYIDSLEKNEIGSEEQTNIETATKTEETIQESEKEEKIEETKNDDIIVQDIKESTQKSAKGVKVVKAIGKILKLEDGRTVKLRKEELQEKPFWRKGDVYYG